MTWQERVFLLTAGVAALTGGVTEPVSERAAVWCGIAAILALTAAFGGRGKGNR